MKNRIFLSIACLALLSVALSVRAAEVTVFAAASLTDVLNEIATTYARQSGNNIVFNFGASSTLARQIEEGAPADVFFSADEAKMDGLEKKGLVLTGTRRSHLANSLVIIVPADSSLPITSARDLTGDKVKRIALADPATVPAGIYSSNYLVKLNLWAAVEPKVVPVENVRAALAAVEAGNVEAGMVYKTDAAVSRKVKVVCEIPRADTPDISYPMAVMKDAKQPDAAKLFLKFLDSDGAARVFQKFGFINRR